jgi:demethylmenaquinone methyltransferase/2-methoxy-6-polyprenyl-1,4-benzoquinol methylase
MSGPAANVSSVSKADYRATLAKRRADVATMFDGVASRYDLTNDVMTFGQVRRWRRLVVDAVDPQPGQRILDLAAGTGTSSRPFADAGALVVPLDLSLGMLRVGKERQPGLQFINGDALSLPFGDATFDAVTISYGLRNVEQTQAALAEMRRVTRPGGRLVVAEFSTPVQPLLNGLYRGLVLQALPRLAQVSSSNKSAYYYLAESIAAWPDQRALADLMVQAGWRGVAWKNLFNGVVALHRGNA